MFCSACGSEVSLAADVCPSCGRATATGSVRVGAAVASDSGARLRLVEPVLAPAPTDPTLAAAPLQRIGSIRAGDLDLPGFPRALAGRVALLTGLVMLADLLLPWVDVNGAGYAPTRIGLPTLGMVALLVLVIAPPLIPRLRRERFTRALPMLVGALTLGFATTLWLLAGPLAAKLTESLIARIGYVAAPELAGALSGSATSILRISPAIGLYLFILGACILTGAGYLALTASNE
ncbi:MAG TPA: zinc ribbon domain-containing protein [Ktedonobacterales bacterium]